jgi:hypothetical protein
VRERYIHRELFVRVATYINEDSDGGVATTSITELSFVFSSVRF